MATPESEKRAADAIPSAAETHPAADVEHDADADLDADTDQDSDTDALSWAGDDPDREDVPRPRRPSATTAMPGAAAERRPTPAALLIVYGVLVGLAAIWTVGWIITVSRSTVTLPTLLSEFMYQFGEFLAIASPALWFGAVFLLTRGRKPIVTVLWLVIGLVVLVPWPTLFGM